MRPPALLTVLLSLSVLGVGCAELEEQGSSTSPLEAVDAVPVAAFAPPEQVASCVEQIKFGAFTGDAAWSEVWNNVGQTDDGASAHCTQLGTDNPGELALVHEGWLQVQAFLAAAAQAEAAPTTTERPSEIPPGPDLNCPDIGRKVWVGSNDYHELDDDDDGWGCDSYE